MGVFFSSSIFFPSGLFPCIKAIKPLYICSIRVTPFAVRIEKTRSRKPECFGSVNVHHEGGNGDQPATLFSASSARRLYTARPPVIVSSTDCCACANVPSIFVCRKKSAHFFRVNAERHNTHFFFSADHSASSTHALTKSFANSLYFALAASGSAAISLRTSKKLLPSMLMEPFAMEGMEITTFSI